MSSLDRMDLAQKMFEQNQDGDAYYTVPFAFYNANQLGKMKTFPQSLATKRLLNEAYATTLAFTPKNLEAVNDSIIKNGYYDMRVGRYNPKTGEPIDKSKLRKGDAETNYPYPFKKLFPFDSATGRPFGTLHNGETTDKSSAHGVLGQYNTRIYRDGRIVYVDKYGFKPEAVEQSRKLTGVSRDSTSYLEAVYKAKYNPPKYRDKQGKEHTASANQVMEAWADPTIWTNTVLVHNPETYGKAVKDANCYTQATYLPLENKKNTSINNVYEKNKKFFSDLSNYFSWY